MGMFDNIICKKKLPLNDELKKLDIKWNEAQFQTKDLDNCLVDYIITKNGQLLVDVKKYEYTYYTKEELKSKDRKPWSFVKDSKLVEHYTKKVDFHGMLSFYNVFEFSNEEDIWVEFNAYFVYGKLDKIELAKTEKQESQKSRMKEWLAEEEALKNSTVYKLKKKLGWFWFWKRVSSLCYTASRFLSTLQTFAIKRMQ
jgi:hypothetical protein